MSEHPQIKRIDAWIELLEQKARLLLDGLELEAEEMSPKERGGLAVKLVTLAQRYMLIRQQREATEPPARENHLIYALMRQMRGEVEAIEEPKDSHDEE
jgi:hypothetical protein